MSHSEDFEQFNFERLKVYQKALDYIDFAYLITDSFPKEEIFGLTSQLRRAACSVALNLGEGSGGTKAEFKNFIRISFRSVNECVVCSTIAQRRNYIKKELEISSRKQLAEIGKMLSGLRNSL
jgi:four helix bundle protein